MIRSHWSKGGEGDELGPPVRRPAGHGGSLRHAVGGAKGGKISLNAAAFAYHYQNCQAYRAYCDTHGMSPSGLTRYEDLARIPPVPSDAFREAEEPIASVSLEDVVLTATTSSTTSSKPCRFVYDQLSLDRLNRANAKVFRGVLGLRGGTIFVFGPPPQESDVALIRGMHLALLAAGFYESDIRYLVREGKLAADAATSEIAEARRVPRYLYGPPFALMHVARELVDRGQRVALEAESRAVVTGGWKRVKGQVSRDELTQTVCSAFGLQPTQVRDCLGLTDVFTMFPECEAGKKHVPPWFHVSIRNPERLDREMSEGETGLLVYLGPLIRSYPPYTMPADMGAQWHLAPCDCGRTGQVVEHRGRATASGARGCAIRMEEFMEIIRR